MKKSYSGFWYILIAAVIYGAFSMFTRLLNDSFGYFTQILLRGVLAAIFAAAIFIVAKGKWKFTRPQLIKTIAVGILWLVGTAAFTMGTNMTKISVLMFMFYVGSFVNSFLISAFYFKEKLTYIKVISVILVILGLLVTTGFNIADISLGALLGIVGGVVDAFSNGLRKDLSALPKEQVIATQFAAGAIVALAAILISGEIAFKEITWVSVVVMIVFGVLLVLVNKLLMKGFNTFDFTLGQVVLSTEIFFAALLAFIFFAEAPTLNELLGGVLIFAGAALVNIKPRVYNSK